MPTIDHEKGSIGADNIAKETASAPEGQDRPSETDSSLSDLVGWPDSQLVVVFFLSLEQPLALPGGSEFWFPRDEPVGWVTWTNGYNFVGLRIYRPEQKFRLTDVRDDSAFEIAARVTGMARPNLKETEALSDAVPFTTMRGTVVEAATVLIPGDDHVLELAISDAFDRCLQNLRQLMRAYLKVTNDARFRPITRQTARMIVPYAFQRLDGSCTHLGMFWANTGTATLHFAPEELSPEQVEKLRVAMFRDSQGDPVALFAERNRAAWRAYEVDGDYTSVVVHTYTACEVLLNTVLLMMAWEEGIARDETRGWFEGQQGFMSRVLKHMPPRLGGNWNAQNEDAPVSRLKRLADFRHQTVHYGYIPGEHDAKVALEASKMIEVFIKARLAGKRKRFPRTALMVLGRPGMIRHNVSERWIDQFMDEFGSNEPSWLDTFDAWLHARSSDEADDRAATSGSS